MINLFLLPANLFDKSLSDIELYGEIYKYFDQQIYNLRNRTNEEINYGSKERFFVPSSIVGADHGNDVRGIDLVVFTYLCLLAFNTERHTVKLDVNELAKKTKIKKTQIRLSISNLIRAYLIESASKSGYYTIIELDLLISE